MSFDLREDGYDVRDHQAGPDAPERKQMADAGWKHRRDGRADRKKFQREASKPDEPKHGAGVPTSRARRPIPLPATPGRRRTASIPEKQQHTGAVLGIAMASYPHGRRRGQVPGLPGDDVKLTFPRPASRPRARATISRSSISTKAR